jgi:hypothetical protein
VLLLTLSGSLPVDLKPQSDKVLNECAAFLSASEVLYLGEEFAVDCETNMLLHLGRSSSYIVYTKYTKNTY